MIVVKWGTHKAEEPLPIEVKITEEGRVDAARDTDTVCAS
jgi:hypothetical protein